MMIWAAFALGIGGSLHCAAMCGPLIFSAQSLNKRKGLNLEFIQYHGGRILAYIGLALVMSLFKLPLEVFGFQQYIALIAGILLAVFLLKSRVPFLRKGFDRISVQLSKAMNGPAAQRGGLVALGFLNGLLPCGLSYAAAAISITQATTLKMVLFMTVFGLGTWPVFAFGSWMSGKSFWKRWNVNAGLRYLMAFTAVFLILRGSGLGIPYLSPKPNIEKAAVDCCHKE
jgi:sulfite exporter TauE/SafE